MQFRSVNPYDGQVIKEYHGHSVEHVNQKIHNAHQAFLQWKESAFAIRSELMQQAANELLKNKNMYGESITMEMGKPIKEAVAEIEKCAKVCSYYAENAIAFLRDETLDTPHGYGYLHYNPLGVILAVMPWNFPFWQVFRFAVPAIMAGNTCLLKHASNVPKCALDIERVFIEAGFPDDIFNTLLIGSSDVGHVIEHKQVMAVTLTGSELAGSSVAAIAGKNIKKSVLELGGSDPFIVLNDADVKAAAKTAVTGRMLNTGQSCIAAKRFILEKGISDEFTRQFIASLDELKYGNPMEPDTDYGTLARKDLAEEIFEQVKESIKKGAKIVHGKLPESIDSAFFPPLILSELMPGMPAYDEEIFGPVASFFTVDNLNEAIQIANQSQFGLGASVWTGDDEKARFMADKIESGAVYINQMMFSDPSVPFGGIKKSGYGRELSYLGIREFVNQKTVWIK